MGLGAPRGFLSRPGAQTGLISTESHQGIPALASCHGVEQGACVDGSTLQRWCGAPGACIPLAEAGVPATPWEGKLPGGPGHEIHQESSHF